MNIETTTSPNAHVELQQLDRLTDSMASSIKTGFDKKVDKVEGKQLSTNDYTTTEKTKLTGIDDGAQVNVIETVKVNGSALTVTEKGINIDLSEYAKSADLTSALIYKGTVASYAELPTADQKVGDVYNVTAADSTHNLNAGENVAWNGSDWDNLGGVTDLSGKVDKETGKGLSTNDFTDSLKKKLEDITVATDEDMDALAAKFSF